MTAGGNDGAAWADAVHEAQRLEAEHPAWRVRPVRRSSGGIGLEAVSDGARRAFIGPPGEVRAALEDEGVA